MQEVKASLNYSLLKLWWHPHFHACSLLPSNWTDFENKFETLLKHCNWQLWNPVLQDLSKFVQQINWDKAPIFWHLCAGSEYKCMEANNMCLAALVFWYPSMFLRTVVRICASHHRSVCGVFWQRWRVTACQTVPFGSDRCWLWEDAVC